MKTEYKEVEIGTLDKENDTVRLAQSGNMQAFERIVTLYEGYVYNLAYNMFNNALDAQDVSQEIFVKIFKNINSFKFNSKFKTWVYRIAINACIDEYNKKKARLFEIQDNETLDIGEFVDISGKTPEQLIEEKEIRDELKMLIKDLPMKYRVPIVLRDLQGLTYDEISQTLKLKLNTVKVRVNRGRMKLRDKYLKMQKKIDKEKEKYIYEENDFDFKLDRKTDNEVNNEVNRKVNKELNKVDKESNKESNKELKSQIDIKIEKEIDKEIEKEIEIEIDNIFDKEMDIDFELSKDELMEGGDK